MQDSDMKTLFHPKWFSYNEKAAELDAEVRKVIAPIISKWLEAGYSPREVESIIFSTMSLEICTQHMKRNVEMHKKERETKKWKRLH